MKRIYVKGNVCGRQYVGHMTMREAAWKFDDFEEIFKAEYQKARADGVPSWGEYETQCKIAGRNPIIR